MKTAWNGISVGIRGSLEIYKAAPGAADHALSDPPPELSPGLEIVEVLLPLHSSGRHGDRPLHGIDSGAVARLRVLLISHTLVSLTQAVMSESEIVLPVGVGRVGRGEALGDGEGVAECGQRLVEEALRLKDITETELRAAEPGRLGCGARERGGVAGFGRELVGFCAP